MVYTYRDLILAYLNKREFADAHEDLASYHSGRFTGLRLLFGVSEQWPENELDDEHLNRVFVRVARSYRSCSSPFRGMLEAPRSIHQLYEKYAKPIDSAEKAFQQVMLDMMAEIFLKVHGKAKADLTFTSADLQRIGHPEKARPDELDYL